MAGTSVAALVVPQGMSYAALAGLPSVYGLYGAFVPVLCYAALGSSRHLVSVAPFVIITHTCQALTLLVVSLQCVKFPVNSCQSPF